MVAVVDAPDARIAHHVGRAVLVQLDPVAAQPRKKLRRRLATAEAIVGHAHLDAGAPPLDEDLRQSFAGATVIEDIGLQMNVVAGFGHGRKHGLIGRRAVHQQFHRIAGIQRPPGQLLADDTEPLQQHCLLSVAGHGFQQGDAVAAGQEPVRGADQ